MKNFKLLIFLSFFSLSGFAQNKYCVDEIKDLNLQFLQGKIITYYSPGGAERAKELKDLLERAAPLFEDSLKVKIEVTMAAVTAKEWAVLLDKPYGLPTMRFGACKRSSTRLPEVKYAAIMPGAVSGPIYDDWIKIKDSLSPSTLKKLTEARVTFEEGGKVLLDFVGLHELGHAYANAFGLKNYVNFFAEFITNYLAYAFLRSTRERLDKKVMAVLSANVDGITPIHSSLQKWEGFRSAEHPPTETWYNSIITLKAAEIYEQRGFEFLNAVRKAFPEEEGKLNTETIITRLDSIHPGILKWSENLSEKVRKKKSFINAQKSPDNNRPNIVFIISDDHRWDAIGAAGNTKIKTPVLDKLASEGVYFRQAITHISVCAPSRATLLTGLSPHQHGYYSNNYFRSDMQWADSFSVPTLPGLLQHAGYRTVLVGKWHLATEPWLTGFSDVRTWLPQAASSYTDPQLANGNSRKTETIKGFTNGIFADDAVTFLGSAAAKEKPFFLWLSATIPHGPYQPNPLHIRKLYQGKTNADLIPPAFPKNIKTNFLLFPDTTQAGMFKFVNYYEAVSYLDELVGQILETLKKQGLSKNTIVVFIGDNGFMSGSRGINGKVVPWEESVRVPLIIHAPMFATVKGRNDVPVSSLDLPGTLLSMAGVTAPGSWVGRNLKPVLKGNKKHGIEYAINEWTDTVNQYRNLAQRSIRTPHYKLIRWHRQDKPDELYDLGADPHETTNVINKPAVQPVHDKLLNQLNAWMKRTNDPAIFWGKKNGKLQDLAAEAKAEADLRAALKYTPVKIDPQIYDAYIGRYEFVTRLRVSIFKEGEKLFLQGDGDKSELIPKSETEFSNKNQTNRFTFFKNEQGQVTHLVRRNSIDAGEVMIDMKGRKIE